MNLQITNILDTKTPRFSPQAKEGSEITPERVYKSFQEWRGLGKQDPTEPQVPSQPQPAQESGENKSTTE